MEGGHAARITDAVVAVDAVVHGQGVNALHRPHRFLLEGQFLCRVVEQGIDVGVDDRVPADFDLQIDQLAARLAAGVGQKDVFDGQASGVFSVGDGGENGVLSRVHVHDFTAAQSLGRAMPHAEDLR